MHEFDPNQDEFKTIENKEDGSFTLKSNKRKSPLLKYKGNKKALILFKVLYSLSCCIFIVAAVFFALGPIYSDGASMFIWLGVFLIALVAMSIFIRCLKTLGGFKKHRKKNTDDIDLTKNNTEASIAQEKLTKEVNQNLICPECYFQNEKGSFYCRKCGAKLGTADKETEEEKTEDEPDL